MNGLGGLTADTLELLRGSVAGMRKASTTTSGITTTTGIVGYDLEDEAKLLYPAHTPIINEMPRVGLTGRQFGVAANWKSIVNINSTSVLPWVSEGKRGGQISYTELDRLATYKGIGLESFVNFEAEYAAEGYEDVINLATKTLLQATKVEEEKTVLWGNTSLLLGTTPTPSLATTTTGTFASGSAYVYCVALTPLGMQLAGGPVAATTGDISATNNVIDTVIRTNADGTTDTLNGGHAAISAIKSIAVNGSQGITATVTGVAGACAYAWYVGAAATAGQQFLAAITTIPTATFTAAGNSANQAANATGLSTDHSTNSLAFDGLITQTLAAAFYGSGGIFNPMTTLSPSAGGAYSKSLAGAALTGTAGTINEIDTMLKWMWDAYKVYPDELWVSAYQAAQITKIAMASTAPLYQVQVAGSQGSVTAGFLVTNYKNKFALGGATDLPIRIHPYLPDSWIFANVKSITDKLPLSNVGVPNRIKARREYYSVAWPVVTRQRTYGVYVDEVLESYVPFAMGLLYDVG